MRLFYVLHRVIHEKVMKYSTRLVEIFNSFWGLPRKGMSLADLGRASEMGIPGIGVCR